MSCPNEGKMEMSLIANRFEEDSAAFDVRFRRCYSMLHLVACRVLSTPEWVEQAVGNCWYTASRYCPRFETEGAFRSWLLRVLIDEALALGRQNQQTPQPKVSLEPVSDRAFAGNNMRDIESNITNHQNLPSLDFLCQE